MNYPLPANYFVLKNNSSHDSKSGLPESQNQQMKNRNTQTVHFFLIKLSIALSLIARPNNKDL